METNKSLCDAVKNEDIPEIRKLLSEGADVNEKETEIGCSALWGSSEGAKIGGSALWRAVYYENEEIVKLLLDAGASANVNEDEDYRFESPLKMQFSGKTKL